MSVPFAGAIADATGPVTSSIAKLGNTLTPTTDPSVDEALAAWRANFISFDQVCAVAQRAGILLDNSPRLKTWLPQSGIDSQSSLWKHRVAASQAYPADQDVFTLLRAGIIDNSQWIDIMNLRGWNDPVKRNWLNFLNSELPGGEQLIGWAGRRMLDPLFVKTFRLDEEFPSDWNTNFAINGMDFPQQPANWTANGGLPFTWAEMRWWDHWKHPDVAQVIELQTRLRGTILNPAIPRDPSGIILDPNAVALYFKATGIAPYWRDKMPALARELINPRQLAKLYTDGLISRSDLVESFLDHKYSLNDSRNLASQIADTHLLKRLDEMEAEIRQYAKQAYLTGTIDEDTFSLNWYSAGMMNIQQLNAFNALGRAGMIAAAKADPITASVLVTLQAQKQADLAKSALGEIKAMFVHGHLNAASTKQRLALLGITQQAQNDYLQTWGAEQTAPFQELKTSELLSFARYGFLTIPQLTQRLILLGWSNIDITLLEANLAREVGLDQQKLALEAAKSLEAQQRAADQLAKQMQRQQQDARKALLMHGNPGQLKSWLDKGIITPAQYASAMTQLGYPADAIARDLDAVAQAVAAKAQTAQQRAATKAARSPRKVSLATLKAWRKKGIIDDADFTARATALGYSAGDVAIMLSAI